MKAHFSELLVAKSLAERATALGTVLIEKELT
jgi:hypothetical protein